MINIYNNDFRLYLQTILNKKFSEINEKDLEKIEVIPINTSIEKFDFKVISLFPNLKSININHMEIKKDDIIELNKYLNNHNIRFYKCMIENNALNGLKINTSIELERCYNEDYSFLKDCDSLEKLSIINPQEENLEIDLKLLDKNEKLKEISLDGCKIKNFDILKKFAKLERVSLLWTELPKNYIDVFNGLANINIVFWDKKYNTELIRNNITIKNDLIEYAFDYEEEER